MELNLDNVHFVCRTCLQMPSSTNPNHPSMLSIFNSFKTNFMELQIIDLIYVCSSVQITQDEILPRRICGDCASKLNMAYEFRKQIEQSESYLQKFLLEPSATIINSNVDESMKFSESQNNSITESSHKMGFKEDQLEMACVFTSIDERNSQIFYDSSHLVNVPVKQEDIVLDNIALHMKLKCIKCNGTFENSSELDTHYCIAPPSNQQKPMNIKYIETQSENPHSNEDIASTAPYLCSVCLNVFASLNDLKYHIDNKSHSTLTDCYRIECLVCHKIFSGKMKLNKHLVNKHYVRTDQNVFKPYQCDNCDKAYTTLANLTLHKATHSGIKPFICEICNRGFYKKNSLATHMAIHTGIRCHLCSQCGRSFTSANILQQHKKTHSNVRPYPCSVCFKGFHTSNDLRVHFRTHTGERPFLCSTCGRGFSRVTHLNIHLRTHSGEKPYVCTTCQKAFAQSGDLKAHIRTHTGEKPYGCTICSKRFNQSSGLTSHIKSHTGERNYVCEVCHKSFTQSSSLARHTKSHR